MSITRKIVSNPHKIEETLAKIDDLPGFVDGYLAAIQWRPGTQQAEKNDHRAMIMAFAMHMRAKYKPKADPATFTPSEIAYDEMSKPGHHPSESVQELAGDAEAEARRVHARLDPARMPSKTDDELDIPAYLRRHAPDLCK